MSRPPPLPDECPAIAYEIEVSRRQDSLLVRAKMVHRMPSGTLQSGFGSMNYPDDHVVYVYEPCRLFRLFGDTIERRLERAKARVTRVADRQIAQERRLEAAVKAGA